MTREHASDNGLRPYVVCIDSRWIRGAEVFEPESVPGNDINLDEIPPSKQDWAPLDHNAFLDIVMAESEADARKLAGKMNGYDSRILFAIPVRYF